MADVTASDVSVNIEPRYRDMGGPALTKKMVAGTIAFGDGALTYPVGGVPLPVLGHLNFVKGLDRLVLEQPVGVLAYRYDRSAHTLRIYGFVTGASAGDPAMVELEGGVAVLAAVEVGFVALGE